MTQKWNMFLGKRFVQEINARDYDRALSAADYIAMKYYPEETDPVVVTPKDERTDVRYTKDLEE